jgi:HK97 family phage major capsid protein
MAETNTQATTNSVADTNASAIEALQAQAKGTTEALGALTKSFGEFVDVMKKTPQTGHPNASDVFGQPNVRTGEDIMGSRGYSLLKCLALVSKREEPENCKIEREVHAKLHGAVGGKALGEPYRYCAGRVQGADSFLAPLSANFFPDEWVDRSTKIALKSLINAGLSGADYDEMKWIKRKQLEALGFGSKAMSWLDEFRGGALVAPPEQGELIELLRNKEALINAGCRVVPLPPQGRMKYPRQTLASNTYWVGESAPITDSTLGTGEVTLQAKKLAVLVKLPDELIRFASPAAEALIRDDMTKSLALGLDLAGLEGAGGDNRPRGLINYPNINRINSSNQTPNGDLIVAKDIYRMVAAIEESNATFEGWIMRPKTLYKYYQLRGDAVAQGDNAGLFLFDVLRDAGDQMRPALAGYPVTKSTQVSQYITKGTNNGCTYILGGMFSDVLIGMFGAIEFAATSVGDTAFINDQTWVRGILSADVAVRHEQAICLLNNVDPTLTGAN